MGLPFIVLQSYITTHIALCRLCNNLSSLWPQLDPLWLCHYDASFVNLSKVL